MTTPTFGKLNKVTNLRDYWEHEAHDFTRWLAHPDNLRALADALGIGDLEPIQVEANAGDFRIDIVARITDRDETVIIENQLEKTDHDHLGKLLTYSAARGATTMIWIAKEFREEHQLALEWLNKQNQSAEKPVSYFAVEIELWRINDSQPAPRFNVVVQPNEYAKSLSETGEPQEVSTTKRLQYDFWVAFKEYCESNAAAFSLKKPPAAHWYSISIGKSGYSIELTLNTKAHRIGCELYIHNSSTKEAFDALKQDRDAIERELKSSLEWERLDHRQASRIIEYRPGDISKQDSWTELFSWLKERVEAFDRVFRRRIASLQFGTDQPSHDGSIGDK